VAAPCDLPVSQNFDFASAGALPAAKVLIGK
jgi:hypothetical protein